MKNQDEFKKIIRNDDEFKKYLCQKFGDKVVTLLLEENSLKLKEGNGNLFSQDTKAENINVVSTVLMPEFSKECDNSKDWAFDFPGWIDALFFEKGKPAKKIMVIGLEPHIQNTYYQVTYGLRESSKNQISFDNLQLKNNLSTLFGKANERDFYNQFYITDMISFAPKGNANSIQGIKQWGKIREHAADKYLNEEIQYIAPLVIVSSGKPVGYYVEKNILQKIGTRIDNIDPPTMNVAGLKTIPFISVYEWGFGKVMHLTVPHLASGQTKSYWNNGLGGMLHKSLMDMAKKHNIQL
jgi:hypothetical protein